MTYQSSQSARLFKETNCTMQQSEPRCLVLFPLSVSVNSTKHDGTKDNQAKSNQRYVRCKVKRYHPRPVPIKKIRRTQRHQNAASYTRCRQAQKWPPRKKESHKTERNQRELNTHFLLVNTCFVLDHTPQMYMYVCMCMYHTTRRTRTAERMSACTASSTPPISAGGILYYTETPQHSTVGASC